MAKPEVVSILKVRKVERALRKAKKEAEELKEKLAAAEKELETLKLQNAMLKGLVKYSHKQIPNYNLYSGQLGIGGRKYC